MPTKKFMRIGLTLIVLLAGMNVWGNTYQWSPVSQSIVRCNAITKQGLKQAGKLGKNLFKAKPKKPNVTPKNSGKIHPKSGVPYSLKGYPIFDYKFRARIPKNMYKMPDSVHFRECNRQLKQAVLNDKSLAKNFSSKQLRQIIEGQKPEGYTWHHSEEEGILDLVDSIKHIQTPHVGGRSIWGGGSSYR
ncbi:MAG: HNH endonuclease [Spirochaetales bacterium]|nr:HNH endonuclease [Spirochaetales bacterium]